MLEAHGLIPVDGMRETMARTTPRVEQEVLVLPEGQKASVLVGSHQWYSWLADENNGSFFFRNEVGSFTARKERRKWGGWYWIAYRGRGEKLTKTCARNWMPRTASRRLPEREREESCDSYCTGAGCASRRSMDFQNALSHSLLLSRAAFCRVLQEAAVGATGSRAAYPQWVNQPEASCGVMVRSACPMASCSASGVRAP